jgi:beta-glucanase (GH16 family)
VFLIAGFFSCQKDSDGSAAPRELPVLVFSDLTVNEDDTDKSYSLNLTLEGTNVTNAVVQFAVVSGTAVSGTDFKVLTEGKLVFGPEEKLKTISLVVTGDEVKETKESFTIQFYNPQNISIPVSVINCTIQDDDDNTAGLQVPTSGYTTPKTYAGYKLVWADEFDSTALSPNNWVHETGATGWGNNELQYYREENTTVVDGHLIITAKEQKFGSSNYTSSRIITKGKRAFKYGRIDIRAALPEGKGLWPALWMLGTNISSVSWPACGEIDIMELAGRIPNRVSAAAHFGANVSQHQYKTGVKYLSGNANFQDEFHVFTLIWKENLLEFYVDDEKFHTITPSDLDGAVYPFNKTFYFLMNVAVGGNFDGNPDATTAFPQSMIVDYIRVFQPM